MKAKQQQLVESSWNLSAEQPDCGMMPPPPQQQALNNHLMMRRSSAGHIGGCQQLISDQLSPSSQTSNGSNNSNGSSSSSLKVEIHDESSQSSTSDVVADMLHQQKSHLYAQAQSALIPAATEASLKTIVAELAAVKQESSSSSMVHPFAAVVDLATVSTAAHALCPCPMAAEVPMVGMMLSQQQQQPATVTQAVAATGPTTNSIQFTDQQLTTISNAINSTNTSPSTSSVIDVGAGLHVDTASRSSNSSSSDHGGLMVAAGSPGPLNCSDIILNSHNAILGASPGNSSPVAATTTGSSGSPLGTASILAAVDQHNNMSPDVILNPTVSPSVLCEPIGASVSVAPVQSLVDPILNMSTAPPPVAMVVGASPSASAVCDSVIAMDQSSQSSLLDSMMVGQQQQQSSPGSNADLIQQQQPQVSTTTAEVVQNIIMNAAVEILSSQQETLTQGSMDAIVSLNNAVAILTQDQQQQLQQMSPENMSGASDNGGGAGDRLVRSNSNTMATNVGDMNVTGGCCALSGTVAAAVATQAGPNLMMATAKAGDNDIHMRSVHDEMAHING